jgi:hypothetical protein
MAIPYRLLDFKNHGFYIKFKALLKMNSIELRSSNHLVINTGSVIFVHNLLLQRKLLNSVSTTKILSIFEAMINI